MLEAILVFIKSFALLYSQKIPTLEVADFPSLKDAVFPSLNVLAFLHWKALRLPFTQKPCVCNAFSSLFNLFSQNTFLFAQAIFSNQIATTHNQPRHNHIHERHRHQKGDKKAHAFRDVRNEVCRLFVANRLDNSRHKPKRKHKEN